MMAVKKIAIFRALQLGDLMCLIPAVRALRSAFPNAEITLLGLPWSKSFVQRYNKYFDKFIEFPGFPGLPERELDPKSFVSFLQKMQNEKFDLVLQMQGSGRLVNPMMFLFGAKVVGGFWIPEAYRDDGRLFVEYVEAGHEAVRMARLMEHLNIPVENYDLEFPTTLGERNAAETIMEEHRLEKHKYVIVHGGARDSRRRWPAGNFAKVADAVAGLGYKIVLTGSKEEAEIANEIESKMYAPCVNLAGLTGLGEAGVLIEKSRLIICNDTGVSHIAAALKTPSVVVFSRYSEPKRWAPLDGILHKVIRPEESTVENVFEAAFDQLKSSLQVHKETV